MVDELSKHPDDVRTLNEPNSWSFALGATAVLGITASIIILLCLFEEAPTLAVTKRHFCCPQIVDEILAAANLTIDPCQNAYEHTCFAYASRWDDYDTRPVTVSTDPVRGFATTEAGRAVAAYYRACLVAPSLNESVGRKAAEAILKYTHITSPMDTESLLELVFTLPLKYGLPSVLNAQVKNKHGRGSYTDLHITLMSASRLPNYFSANETDEIRTDICNTINDALLSNVGLKDVYQFFQELDKISSYEEINSLESLLTLTTRVTVGKWKKALVNLINFDAVKSISGVPLRILNSTLENFLDPERQPRTTALALVSSSIHLVSRIAITTEKSEDRRFFCEVRAKELQPLWILDSIGYFPTQSQDVAIRRTYLALVSVITRKLSTWMPSEDLQNLMTELNEVRLLLPSEVVPKSGQVPNFDIPFAQAYLEGREYMFWAFTHHTRALHIGEDFIKDLGKKSITSANKTLVVPTVIYKMVRLENNTDPIVVMPTIGVLLADAVWKAVFSVNSSNNTTERLNSYHNCLADSLLNVTQFHSSSRPPDTYWLSLESSVEACRADNWRDPLDKSERWNLTRGQAFYMIYVAYHHCKPAMGSALPLAAFDASAFLSSFSDYLRSYRCNDNAVSRSTSACSLQRA
ncbi:hypothetical protein V5799_008545 [Amblyomma americanum]|uniref:Uncharacterized protein n=1 Tax=Amblyomma americanum TaxID=6943 RepID=A0AAQ4FCY5_AMBAM